MNREGKLDTYERLSQFLHELGGIHDCLIKEMRLTNPSYIDQDRNIVNGGDPTLEILIQQADPHAPNILLTLHEVWSLKLDTAEDITAVSSFHPDGALGIDFDTQCKVVFQRLEYRFINP